MLCKALYFITIGDIMTTCKHDLIFIQHIQATTFKANGKEYAGEQTEHIAWRIKCRQCQYDRKYQYTVDFPRWLKARMPFLIAQGLIV
jgi:hypothetical protein